jgi:hypothetical protein
MVRFLAQKGRVPRHMYMLLAVLMILLATGKDIEHIPARYIDSATIVFVTDTRSLALSPNSTVDGSLITTDAVTVGSFMDAQSRALVRQAGGMADFSLSLINFDNQDFPEYSYPLATLITQSANPFAAYRTFNAALKVLRHLLTGLQVRVPRLDRISLSVVGATGPVRHQGSLKRSLVAIGLLALIGAGVLSGFLNRNRNWFRVSPRLDTPVPGKHVARHRMPRRQTAS